MKNSSFCYILFFFFIFISSSSSSSSSISSSSSSTSSSLHSSKFTSSSSSSSSKDFLYNKLNEKNKRTFLSQLSTSSSSLSPSILTSHSISSSSTSSSSHTSSSIPITSSLSSTSSISKSTSSSSSSSIKLLHYLIQFIKLFQQFKFKGIILSLSKGLNDLKSCSIGFKIPISPNFPLYDTNIFLPKIICYIGIQYPLAYKFTITYALPIQIFILILVKLWLDIQLKKMLIELFLLRIIKYMMYYLLLIKNNISSSSSSSLSSLSSSSTSSTPTTPTTTPPTSSLSTSSPLLAKKLFYDIDDKVIINDLSSTSTVSSPSTASSSVSSATVSPPSTSSSLASSEGLLLSENNDIDDEDEEEFNESISQYHEKFFSSLIFSEDDKDFLLDQFIKRNIAKSLYKEKERKKREKRIKRNINIGSTSITVTPSYSTSALYSLDYKEKKLLKKIYLLQKKMNSLNVPILRSTSSVKRLGITWSAKWDLFPKNLENIPQQYQNNNEFTKYFYTLLYFSSFSNIFSSLSSNLSSKLSTSLSTLSSLSSSSPALSSLLLSVSKHSTNFYNTFSALSFPSSTPFSSSFLSSLSLFLPTTLLSSISSNLIHMFSLLFLSFYSMSNLVFNNILTSLFHFLRYIFIFSHFFSISLRYFFSFINIKTNYGYVFSILPNKKLLLKILPLIFLLPSLFLVVFNSIIFFYSLLYYLFFFNFYYYYIIFKNNFYYKNILVNYYSSLSSSPPSKSGSTSTNSPPSSSFSSLSPEEISKIKTLYFNNIQKLYEKKYLLKNNVLYFYSKFLNINESFKDIENFFKSYTLSIGSTSGYYSTTNLISEYFYHNLVIIFHIFIRFLKNILNKIWLSNSKFSEDIEDIKDNNIDESIMEDKEDQQDELIKSLKSFNMFKFAFASSVNFDIQSFYPLSSAFSYIKNKIIKSKNKRLLTSKRNIYSK